MLRIDPYITFPGTAEEAMNFYKTIFGGEFTSFQRFKDMPGQNIPANDQNKIMHVSLPIGKDNCLMACDAIESMSSKPVIGNSFQLCLSPESEDQATTLFHKLSAGGTITMPLEKTFWNAYFGMCIDKFGIKWMINLEEK